MLYFNFGFHLDLTSLFGPSIKNDSLISIQHFSKEKLICLCDDTITNNILQIYKDSFGSAFGDDIRIQLPDGIIRIIIDFATDKPKKRVKDKFNKWVASQANDTIYFWPFIFGYIELLYVPCVFIGDSKMTSIIFSIIFWLSTLFHMIGIYICWKRAKVLNTIFEQFGINTTGPLYNSKKNGHDKFKHWCKCVKPSTIPFLRWINIFELESVQTSVDKLIKNDDKDYLYYCLYSYLGPLLIGTIVLLILLTIFLEDYRSNSSGDVNVKSLLLVIEIIGYVLMVIIMIIILIAMVGFSYFWYKCNALKTPQRAKEKCKKLFIKAAIFTGIVAVISATIIISVVLTENNNDDNNNNDDDIFSTTTNAPNDDDNNNGVDLWYIPDIS